MQKGERGKSTHQPRHGGAPDRRAGLGLVRLANLENRKRKPEIGRTMSLASRTSLIRSGGSLRGAVKEFFVRKLALT